MAKSRHIWKAKRTVRKAVVALGKHVPFVHAGARSALTQLRGFRYRRMCRTTSVDARTVVFESYMGRAYACSPRALFSAMTRDSAYRDFTLVWAFKPAIVGALLERGGYDIRGCDDVYIDTPYSDDLERTFGTRALEELRRAVIVPWGSPEYYRTYARAGVWVSNSRIPAHLIPRERQVYVQTWHGTPLKRLGYDITRAASGNALYSHSDIRRQYDREGRRLTYLLSPSEYASEKFASAFNLVRTGRTSTIIEEGYPRNDRLYTCTADEVAEIRARLDVPEDKRVVLYAPTWRDDQHASGIGYVMSATADFNHLRRELGDEYVILFRAHYFIANSLDLASFGGFVRDVSSVSDINDLHLVSDVLVTDYSSVFFDFANLRRPIVFLMPDLERYADEIRGFYLDLDELPGPVVRDEAGLVDALARGGADYAEQYAAFTQRYNCLDDGHAAERVLRRLFPELEEPANQGHQ